MCMLYVKEFLSIYAVVQTAERNRLNIHEGKRVGGDDIDVALLLSNMPGRVLTLHVCVCISAHTESLCRIQ